MRLLVVTQTVDLESDVLGFVHDWLETFADHFEEITVAALSRGATRLPANVHVESLGKESGRSRLLSVVAFFGHVWRERRRYDAVLVHMTPIFLVLGWPVWKLLGKRVALWYNHRRGGLLARTAVSLSDVVFFTSRFAYSSRFAHATAMPAGVSTDRFRPFAGVEPAPRSLLYLGRLSPVKNVDCLVAAAHLLDDESYPFRCDIVGAPAVASDRAYERRLKEASRELCSAGKIRFEPAVRNRDAPRVYNEHELFVNLTPAGSFDKTVLEAMSCGALVLVSNRSFEELLPDDHLFVENDARDLARKIRALLDLSPEEKVRRGEELRRIVVETHGVERLAKEMSGHLKVDSA